MYLTKESAVPYPKFSSRRQPFCVAKAGKVWQIVEKAHKRVIATWPTREEASTQCTTLNKLAFSK
jgi:hypothetical protein